MSLPDLLGRLVDASARHRKAVVAAWLLAALASVALWPRLRLDALPDLSEVQVVVVTEWMGRSPAAVEAQVTTPIASRLLGTPSVRAVRGQSMAGMSYLYVLFDDGTPLDRARGRVLEQLAGLRGGLPPDATPGLGAAASGVGWVYQYALSPAAESARPPPSIEALRAYQDTTLRYLVAAVPGVTEVATVGGAPPQYNITLDPDRLRARDVALGDVIRALRTATTDVDGGALEIAGRELQVTLQAPARSVETLEAISVRGGEAPVRIRDVARVTAGGTPQRGLTDLDGRGDHVGGIVIMRDGENALAVIARVKQALADAAPTLPPGVQVVTTYDRSGLIQRALATLRRALLEETVAVVCLILAFLLHLRSALLPALSLPLAVLVTLGVLAATGVPATIMSLGGIAIALGATVDAEIVMLEACHRHLSAGVAPGQRRAALAEAGREITPAIVCSLLAIAIAFLPVFALGGQAGRLFAPLAFAKTTVMVVSALMSVTLAPALRDLVLRGHMRKEADNPLARLLVAVYRPFVTVALRNPRWTLATGLLALLSAVPLAGTLGEEFMPDLDEGDLLYMPTTIATIGPHEAQRHLQAQDRALRALPEVETVFGKVGRAGTATDPAPLSMIETTVRLRPPSTWRRQHQPRWYSGWAPAWLRPPLLRLWPEKRPMTRAQLVAALEAAVAMPGWTGAWTMPIRARIDMQSTGVRTPVGVKIFGRDLPAIDRTGRTLARLLATLPGTRSATFEESLSGRTLEIVPDLDAMARHGVALADLQSTIAAATGGVITGHINRYRTRLPVVLRFPGSVRDNVDALGEILVPATPRSVVGIAPPRAPLPVADPEHPGDEARATPAARGFSGARTTFVRLSEIAALREESGPAMVRNEGGLPVGYLYVDVDTNAQALGDYVRAGTAALARWQDSGALSLAAGTFLRWTGQYEALAETRSRLKVVVPLALLAIALLLFALLRNVAETLIVLLSIPFALVGSLWALALLDYRLSTAVWVGLIAVVGLAAQTGVVMIVYIDQAYERRRRAGLIRGPADILAAHLEGTVQRVRPKIMTVAAMTLGLVPLLWADSSGADVMKRIAAPMVGGLISSAFLTLELIPVVYTAWRCEQLLWEGVRLTRPLIAKRAHTAAAWVGVGVLIAGMAALAPLFVEDIPLTGLWAAPLLGAGAAALHYLQLRRTAR